MTASNRFSAIIAHTFLRLMLGVLGAVIFFKRSEGVGMNFPFQEIK